MFFRTQARGGHPAELFACVFVFGLARCAQCTVALSFPPGNAGFAGVRPAFRVLTSGETVLPGAGAIFLSAPPCSGPSPELKPLPVAVPSNRRTPKTFLMEYFQASSRFLHTHAL
ncbi:hypothetical protein SAMN04488048_10940 [Trichococcus flocculiformis]|nr:Hypothetical protein TES5_1628 [Trichococcus sp. ES5]SHF68053.1 hypothetical protein SAMN04488048_10940 [Trichococcus flocculiformis]